MCIQSITTENIFPNTIMIICDLPLVDLKNMPYSFIRYFNNVQGMYNILSGSFLTYINCCEPSL